ncbi:MAG: GSCFA domain-containing protein [Bacteroidaceae bacterium]
MSENTLFRTSVETPLSDHPIQPHESCVLLGSCFAQEMGNYMKAFEMDVLCNPTGTLYNPASIALLVHHALKKGGDLPIFTNEDKWRCWLAGTQIEENSREAIMTTMREKLELLNTALCKSTHFFITLGTNICYRLKENNEVVTNCHKMPANLFTENALSPDECITILHAMADEVLDRNPHLHITFTISPYRYAKYGFHKNQIAKSTLLLAVEEICQTRKEVSYFPAYEILLDELRDYRFYAEDMLHPSPTAVAYIWQRFCQAYMSEQTHLYLKEYEQILKGFAHRPSSPDCPRYKAFIANLENKRETLRKKYNMQG